jgi:signal transduction histidine kinase
MQSELAIPRKLSRDIPTGIAISIILATALFVPVIPSWHTFLIGVAFHSLLAFLAIMAAAWTLGEFTRKLPIYELGLFSILVSKAIIHINASIEFAFSLGSSILDSPITNMTIDLFEAALLGIILFISGVVYRRNPDAKISWWMVPIAIVLELSIDGFFVFVLTPQLDDGALQLFGVASFILAVATLLAAGFLRSRTPFITGDRQTSVLIISFIIFAAATFPLLHALFFPSAFWALGMVMQSLGFLAFTIAMATPRLLKWGMSDRASIGVPGFLSMLPYLPFIISIIASSLAPEFYVVDLGAYYITHLGAAMLSGVMTFLIYTYHKQKPEWIHYPLILLFLSWTYIELHIVIFSQPSVLLALGETLVPYIVGSISSVILLIGGIIWTLRTGKADEMPKLEYWVSFGLITVISMVLGGEFIERWILAGTPGLSGSPLGRVILLSINLVAMFVFTYLSFLEAKRQKRWRTIEAFSVGILALWIIPNFLKGVFDDWVLGWWAAEVFLLIGLLLGPALIGALYLQEMVRSDEARRRATLYSDILAHDISNLHQAMTVALGLMEMEGLPRDMQEMALQDARGCLRRADQLVKNVRGLGMTDPDGSPPLERIDLVGAIDHAFEQVLMELPDQTVEVLINRDTGECYVTANGLLSDLFYNLFRNAIAYSREHRRIVVEIDPVNTGGSSFWATRVIDFGKGIEPEKKVTLFQRFMEGAEGTGLGLSVVYALTETFGGTIAVEDRVEGDYTQGTVFIVTLPAILE